MHISEPCVFDAVLRMRTNSGIRPVEFCGNFMMQHATDMEIAVLKPSSTVTIEIKHDDKLSEDFHAYVQVRNVKYVWVGQVGRCVINLQELAARLG